MYVELHTRSAFSFLEGGSLPEELISACSRHAMPAMALLDRDGVYGAPRFHMAANKAGLRAHIGAEVSVRDEGLQSVAPAWIETPAAPQPVRYSLLVETAEGYRNLCRLITQYKLREKAKGEGRATLEELQAYSKGLVCLTGGAEGPLAAAFARGGHDAARIEVERLVQIFGAANVYVELQRHFGRQEESRNQAAVRLARSLGLPLLATLDARVAGARERADAEAAHALLAVDAVGAVEAVRADAARQLPLAAHPLASHGRARLAVEAHAAAAAA
ncbi:MAG: PHP domain-containing protein, partial [Acidobacteriales bacterium]|nr:PHP domain-containing protein [Terriglobales bacterium]